MSKESFWERFDAMAAAYEEGTGRSVRDLDLLHYHCIDLARDDVEQLAKEYFQFLVWRNSRGWLGIPYGLPSEVEAWLERR